MAANKKTGVIKYTETAFEQDAGQAMKNDIVRALIELITNADDAYARVNKIGAIEIIVSRPVENGEHTRITVRDRATGLDPQGMEDNFVVLGGDKSGFAEGQEVRGLFSRGSKDTAWFGETVFESIKDGQYSTLVLNNKGQWESDNEIATAEHRERLGLKDGENGLSATMVVTRQDTRVPSLADLVRRLGSHVQLRQVVQTQDVTVAEYRGDKLVQAPKVVWEVPNSKVLFDGEIQIAGYDCTAQLTINRLAERSDGPVSEDSTHGIEVRGGRAAYMNTMFGQTGPGIAFINGVVTCATIDKLIREFGAANSADPKNPLRLVSRSRDGLEATHPFMKALNVAVLEKLKPLLEELDPKPAEAGSPELRKDLDKFARLLAEEMKLDLDDDEDDGIGGNLPTPLKPIIVIPPVAKIRLGTKGTLTVLVLEGSAGKDGLSVVVSSGVCSAAGEPTELKPHAAYEGILVGQVRLDSHSLGSATVVVSATSKPADAGSAEVIIHDSDGQVSAPTSLEWKNSQMSVTNGKTRSVRLRAPIDIAPSGELEATITLSGTNIRLEDNKVTLKLTKQGWLEARVRVTGLVHSSDSCSIVATANGETAEGSIRTTIPNPLGGLNIVPDLRDEFAGPLRGQIVVEDDFLKLVMYGRHRGLQARLGTLRPDGSYTRDTELDCLVVIAEVMASVAGDHILMLKVKRDPAMYQDIDKVMYERTKLVDRYLKIMLEGISVSKA